MKKMFLRVSAALAVLCLAVTLNVYAKEGSGEDIVIEYYDPDKNTEAAGETQPASCYSGTLADYRDKDAAHVVRCMGCIKTFLKNESREGTCTFKY